MRRILVKLNDLLLLSDFLSWLDRSIDPAERVEGRMLLRRVLWRVASAMGLSGVVAAYLLLTAGAAVTDDALVPGQETGVEVNLPPAPRSPDGVTTCPPSWRSTPGTIPPDAVQQLPQTHVGARAFYVCRKDAFEITMLDNGYVFGFEGNNPLSPEDARRALTR